MQKRQKINWDKNFKGQDMLLEEKVKISELSEFSILTYTKIENLEISESVLLLQILTVVVT